MEKALARYPRIELGETRVEGVNYPSAPPPALFLMPALHARPLRWNGFWLIFPAGF